MVSSFSSHDMDPGRLIKPGARLLAEYLAYAQSGGTPVAASGSGAGLGPFEADVTARLAELGIMVAPQYGVGGYRVDFAVAHPDDPARMILAVEADGASYRDSGSVRDRDRLRKEHLERLGWRVHLLWFTSWFTDPEAELAKLRAAYTQAIRANPVAAAEPDDGGAPAPGGPQSPRPQPPPAGIIQPGRRALSSARHSPDIEEQPDGSTADDTPRGGFPQRQSSQGR